MDPTNSNSSDLNPAPQATPPDPNLPTSSVGGDVNGSINVSSTVASAPVDPLSLNLPGQDMGSIPQASVGGLNTPIGGQMGDIPSTVPSTPFPSSQPSDILATPAVPVTSDSASLPQPIEMPASPTPQVSDVNLGQATLAQGPSNNISSGVSSGSPFEPSTQPAATQGINSGVGLSPQVGGVGEGSFPSLGNSGVGGLSTDAPVSASPLSSMGNLSQPLGSSLEVNGSPMSSGMPVESAPTDLSHLVGGVLGADPSAGVLSTAPDSQPNVVVPTPVAQDTPQVVTNNSSGFPKWILAVGGVVMLLVIGVSAYFILGVGKSEETTSIPAEQQSLTNPPQAILPTAVPTLPIATTSAATFGSLEGGNQATTSANSFSGTSALERLRQKITPTTTDLPAAP